MKTNNKHHYTELARLINDEFSHTHPGLMKDLNQLELQASRSNEDWANGDINEALYDINMRSIKDTLKYYLGPSLMAHIELNTDPRGYALKFTEEYSKEIADKYNLTRDAGGHVLIAPDAYDIATL